MGSYKIIYSGLEPPDVPFVVPAEPRRLHIRVVVGLAFQFVPDGAISFEPLLVHACKHRNVRVHIVIKPILPGLRSRAILLGSDICARRVGASGEHREAWFGR